MSSGGLGWRRSASTPGLPSIGGARPVREPLHREWQVDGGELGGLEWTAGASAPVVLAAHGITANAAMWQLVADRLPAARILAPDLRGRGRSNHLPGPWSLARLADDLARVLDAAGIERAVVAGHSMGGFVGVRFAERHADRVESLVLVDGGLPTPPVSRGPDGALPRPHDLFGPASDRLTRTFASREDYREFWRAHPAFGPWWNAAIEAFSDADLEPAPGGFVPATMLDAMVENALELDGRDGYAHALLGLRVPMAFIRSPKGIVNDDPLYPADYAEEWVRRIAGVANVEADATNHYTVLLAPHGADVTAAVIRGVVEISAARERARSMHPATGRLRVIRAVDDLGR
ncbi:MAG: alpha/beta fold hydrolase [Pseudoclavibacter sp.]